MPCLIVGTQVDLRDDAQVRDKLAKQRMSPVRKEDGERMAKDLGAVKYVECSALTQYKLKDVFDEVSRSFLLPRCSSPSHRPAAVPRTILLYQPREPYVSHTRYQSVSLIRFNVLSLSAIFPATI